MDRVSAEKRSDMMAKVRRKDTAPEMRVRRIAHAMGYRYRLHDARLPGRPDIVFPRRKVAIFVHGCFWHRHVGCRKASVPEANREFWLRKFDANVMRDRQAVQALEDAGWRVLVIWECESRNDERLAETLATFLGRVGPGRFADRWACDNCDNCIMVVLRQQLRHSRTMARRPEPSSEDLARRLERVARERGCALSGLAVQMGEVPSTFYRGCKNGRWSKALVARIGAGLDRLEGRVSDATPDASPCRAVASDEDPGSRIRDIDEALKLLQYMQQGLEALRREVSRSDELG
ncbi:DNA mismatch endonuclease Vsr [Azospirillum sp. INR13]|nr:DNA mismatch endonuclease Vsr [Azospirillum sp. INR13]